MINNQTYALSTSLLRARLGLVAPMPPTEQQIVEQVCATASGCGYPQPDLMRAIYVGLKLRYGICLCGAPVEHSLLLLDLFAATFVGAQSEQIIKLRAPDLDPVARRFGALRISELIANALDPAQQDKSWFLLVHGEDADAVIAWTQAELAAAMRAEARQPRRWPPNVLVLSAATTGPIRQHRHWLAWHVPAWTLPSPLPLPGVPPVGYQRQLVAGRLCGPAYYQWLRREAPEVLQQHETLPPKLVGRWLAAGVDARGCGLWVPDDLHANAQRAVAVLAALTAPPPA